MLQKIGLNMDACGTTESNSLRFWDFLYVDLNNSRKT